MGVKTKKASSQKANSNILKVEVFLKAFSEQVDNITVIHWNKKEWKKYLRILGKSNPASKSVKTEFTGKQTKM